MILKTKLFLLAAIAFSLQTAIAQDTEKVLTTNNSKEIQTNARACSDSKTGVVLESHYFKKFDFANLGVKDEFEIHSFQFVVQSVHTAKGFDSKVKLEVKLWQTKTKNFPANWGSRDYNELVTKTVYVTSADNDAIITIDFDHPITVDKEDVLIVEVTNKDLKGQRFYIGSNNAGDKQTSYIMAKGCNLSTPTPVADIGFPDMNIVMGLNGVGTILSIEDKIPSTSLALYPNPTSDQFHINSGNEQIKSITVIDITGRTIQTITANSHNQSVNVSNLPIGIYLIQIDLETEKIVKKLIKK